MILYIHLFLIVCFSWKWQFVEFWYRSSSKIWYVILAGKLCRISLLQYFSSGFVLSSTIYKILLPLPRTPLNLNQKRSACQQDRRKIYYFKKGKYHENPENKKQAFEKRYHHKNESIRQHCKEKYLMNRTSEISYEKAKYQKNPEVQLAHEKCKYLEIAVMKKKIVEKWSTNQILKLKNNIKRGTKKIQKLIKKLKNQLSEMSRKEKTLW